jgi:AcrR family transcriptional regulator
VKLIERQISLGKDSYHHGDLKNALIEAGLQIISREGIDDLSIRSVAKKIGVSHAAPYRHFKNKEDLIVAIALTGYQIRGEEVDMALKNGSDNPWSQLISLAKADIVFAENHPDYFRVMYRDYIKNKKDYPDLFLALSEAFQQWVGIIKECRKRSCPKGEIPTFLYRGKKSAMPCSTKEKTLSREEAEKRDAEIAALAMISLIQGYASFIIDNRKSPVLGKPVQIDLITRKLWDLV